MVEQDPAPAPQKKPRGPNVGIKIDPFNARVQDLAYVQQIRNYYGRRTPRKELSRPRRALARKIVSVVFQFSRHGMDNAEIAKELLIPPDLFEKMVSGDDGFYTWKELRDAVDIGRLIRSVGPTSVLFEIMGPDNTDQKQRESAAKWLQERESEKWTKKSAKEKEKGPEDLATKMRDARKRVKAKKTRASNAELANED